MGRRGRKADAAASFDSLLDTMTNVVGILVIMLVVTLLGVRDAVQRIKWKLPDISQQELDELRALAAQKQDKMAANQVKIAEIKDILAQLRKLKEEKKELQEPNTPAAIQKNLAQTNKTLTELREEIKKLKAEAKEADEEIARLRKILEELPTTNPHGTKVVRMPNPRSPPPGSTPLWFMCRYNHIARLDQEELVSEALARIVSSKNLLVERERGKVVTVDWETGRVHPELEEIKGWVFDPKKMIAYFEQRALGNKQFRLSLEVKPPDLNERLLVEMRKGAGDSLKELDSMISEYQKTLRDFDKEKHYARFIVYPDSFEVYVKAREDMEAEGIPAGWTLYYQDEYPIASNVGLHFVGEPKPKPPPPQPPTPATPPKPVAPVPVLD